MRLINRYEIISEVGRGGMAVVYKAYDPLLNRIVAIKMIQIEKFGSSVLSQIRERFAREGRAMAKLKHPNIVNILDFGEFEGIPFLVMDYLEGITLKALDKPIGVDAAVKLLLPIANALSYIHGQGMIHRDVKPSNIIVINECTPILTDFGIVKLLENRIDDRSLTETGSGLGTPEYMSPEQGLGKTIDSRSDMYSLSVIFYELITGEKLYKGDSALSILFQHATAPIPDPRNIIPEISESVKLFLDRSLAKDARDRYPNFIEYALDLKGLNVKTNENHISERKLQRQQAQNKKLKKNLIFAFLFIAAMSASFGVIYFEKNRNANNDAVSNLLPEKNPQSNLNSTPLYIDPTKTLMIPSHTDSPTGTSTATESPVPSVTSTPANTPMPSYTHTQIPTETATITYTPRPTLTATVGFVDLVGKNINVNWSDIEELIERTPIEWEIVKIEDAGIQFNKPIELQPKELTPESIAAGITSFYSNHVGNVNIVIQHVPNHEINSIEEYIEVLVGLGVKNPQRVTINGFPAVNYVMQNNDNTAATAVKLDQGWIEFAYTPALDKGFESMMLLTSYSIRRIE